MMMPETRTTMMATERRVIVTEARSTNTVIRMAEIARKTSTLLTNTAQRQRRRMRRKRSLSISSLSTV
jgi:hypothetical protein